MSADGPWHRGTALLWRRISIPVLTTIYHKIISARSGNTTSAQFAVVAVAMSNPTLRLNLRDTVARWISFPGIALVIVTGGR